MGSFKATRAILVLFMGLAFLGSANAATKKNVVFVLIDALRADQIEGTRNGVPLMPYLNGLSAVRFKNATSPASWTLPAMASLFTSQYVDTHGVFAQGTALPANLQSMAAWFKQAGYSTVGIQTNGNLSAQRGFGQGFDQYDAIIDGFAENVTAHTLADTQSLTQPFFLYTHYLDPHMPYIPPQSYRALLGYPAPTLPPAEQAIAEDFIPYFWDHLDYVMGVKPAPTYPDLSPVGRDSVRALYDAEARYTDDQVRIARAIQQQLQPWMNVFYDDGGAVGRRYRRQDEIGTPFCITVDFDTVGENGPEKEGTVTLRHRDSMQQERVAIADLKPFLLERIA